MLTPGARVTVRWVRHGVLAVVALGLSLMCASVATGTAAATLSSSDMGSMSALARPPAVGQRAAESPVPMPGMCDSACAGGTLRAVCTVAATAAPLTLLGLLVARRRTSYLGLLRRANGPLIVGRERWRWCGWSVLSPVSLCVWRV